MCAEICCQAMYTYRVWKKKTGSASVHSSNSTIINTAFTPLLYGNNSDGSFKSKTILKDKTKKGVKGICSFVQGLTETCGCPGQANNLAPIKTDLL
jgi:hypothetical protein